MKKNKFIALGLLAATSYFAMSAVNAYARPYQLNKSHSAEKTHSNIISVAQTSDEIVQGAQNFIENVSARGLAFLSDKNLSEEDRKKDFRALLMDSFDLNTIGRFALGTNWRSLTAEQKEEYLDLFHNMVIETYSQRFREYQGQQIVINRARPEGEKDSIVNSKIISTDGSPDIQLDWRVRYKDGQYRIIDVLVEGVSMSLTQRSEFSSIVQRGGGNVESLLVKLRER